MNSELEDAWQQIEAALGPEIGPSLPFAREYIGDVAFIQLSRKYSAGLVVVACGIDNAATLTGITLTRGRHTARDWRLHRAVQAAHAQQENR